MRMLLKASLDTEKANEVIRSGKMPQLMQQALDAIKPEAAYFTVEGGDRTAYLFFDMADSAQMPPVGEPFFMDLGARVEFTPVMNGEDLSKGLSQLR
ncbi:hypothetical protein [Streptomyces mangrovisoli]|uniref:Uncharacterized protein n=1 Tax=Streptomyces mangrovisoli TaxID=1428628 RepID=A0A1J4P4H1_9ACTN|nr:hypothetical protein [Streptomyces mangrovisoli]OIJ69647.1 hypothetical protein WN71_001865 [Streptomyces mangrovisoli]